LTWDQVDEIRARHSRGVQQSRLAAEFETSRSAICKIVNLQSWRHR